MLSSGFVRATRLDPSAIEAFAASELRERLATDAADVREAWRRCGEVGLAGAPIPVAYGGCGATARETAAAFEAAGFGSGEIGFLTAIGAHLLSVAVPIWRMGTDAQRQQWLPGLCAGTLIGAHAATEPDAGSDVFSLQTTAESRGAAYILNGTKAFCLNAPLADLFLVLARTSADGPAALSSFLVPRATRGLSVSPVDDLDGLSGAVMGTVTFRDCEVDASARLGPAGNGTLVFHTAMRWERTLIAAPAVGAMRRALDLSIAFATGRRQFGQPIARFQSVSNRLADMHVRAELSRLLLDRAAAALDQGARDGLHASMAKLFIAESALQTATDAMRIHGARGCRRTEGLSASVQAALALTVLSGTSDVQRQIIARQLGC